MFEDVNNETMQDENVQEGGTVPQNNYAAETPAEQPGTRFCTKCGAPLAGDALFCSKCGQKAASSDDSADRISQFNNSIEKSAKKKKMLPIFVAAAVIAVILIIVIVTGVTGNKNFKDMYSDMASKTWCTIAPDGSYMIIDSNPADWDSDDYPSLAYMYVTDADNAVKQINKDLGFSSAVIEKMRTTTWSQGRQVETNKNYKVTWTYHPDKGLEVMYEIIDN